MLYFTNSILNNPKYLHKVSSGLLSTVCQKFLFLFICACAYIYIIYSKYILEIWDDSSILNLNCLFRQNWPCNFYLNPYRHMKSKSGAYLKNQTLKKFKIKYSILTLTHHYFLHQIILNNPKLIRELSVGNFSF